MTARDFNAAEVSRLLRFGCAQFSSQRMANLIASTQPHETHAAPPPQLEALTPTLTADEAPADGDLPLTPAADEALADCDLPQISFRSVLTNGRSDK